MRFSEIHPVPVLPLQLYNQNLANSLDFSTTDQLFLPSGKSNMPGNLSSMTSMFPSRNLYHLNHSVGISWLSFPWFSQVFSHSNKFKQHFSMTFLAFFPCKQHFYHDFYHVFSHDFPMISPDFPCFSHGFSTSDSSVRWYFKATGKEVTSFTARRCLGLPRASGGHENCQGHGSVIWSLKSHPIPRSY